jgi:hypothetical protein
MKNILYILTLMMLSCNNQDKQTNNPIIENSVMEDIEVQKIDNSKYHTIKDTFLITTELGHILKFSKIDYNNIIDKHPEFLQEYPDNPDQLYYNGNDRDEFSSEMGQDTYYTLYAYFLKQRNGENRYTQQRKKLIDIYSCINSLFGHLQYGGTYFGHQKMRIIGYAEYSIYIIPKDKNDFEKTYDITKQKDLYIKSLRQLIEDENKVDYNTLGEDKVVRTKELNIIIDQLDSLITDNFYLRRAQEFHYGHYEYH